MNADLVAFAKEIIRESWEGCDNGEAIHDAAVKHGLLRETQFNPKVHKDPNGYAEPGDPWFVFAGPLAP
jgi:hypothetical protein